MGRKKFPYCFQIGRKKSGKFERFDTSGRRPSVIKQRQNSFTRQRKSSVTHQRKSSGSQRRKSSVAYNRIRKNSLRYRQTVPPSAMWTRAQKIIMER
ncbi:Hypothetical predicted protein [Mytilus galloprovincialis]|uniref:Uncharacterized protein n=1 Tax=Mytilus galloprovincialis TaxID=29158 RepID=A0A8B6FTH0_MYTGA|nr:Hypothetical predicted protein [Mytilus galloprovincialis]